MRLELGRQFGSPGAPHGRRSAGFTLIEIMIVVVVVSILASIALPSYQDSVRKSRRSSAQSFLLEVAQKQQQKFSSSRRFSSDLAGLGLKTPDVVSKYYEIEITLQPGPPAGFLITAKPLPGQDKDGPLSIDRAGKRLPADKW